MKDKRFIYTLIYFVSMLLLIVVRVLYDLGVFSRLSVSLQNNVFSLLVQCVAMGVVPFALCALYLRRRGSQNATLDMLQDFGYTRNVSLKGWILVLTISVISPYLIVCVSNAWQNGLYLIGYTRASSGSGGISTLYRFVLEIIFTAMLPAIFEEFVNRGVMLAAYKDAKKPMNAVLVTALMFALMHTNITQFGYTFVCGIIAGAMVLLTRSIYPAMAYHYINNLFSVARSYGDGADIYVLNLGNRLYDWIFGEVVGGIVGVVLFFVVLLLIFRLMLELAMLRKPQEDVGEVVTYTAIDKMFLSGTIVLTAAVTLFTLIWGLIR